MDGSRVLIIALIAAVVVMSGCVGQTPTSSTLSQSNGLVIKNLNIDPPADQILSGEAVIITADIENIGSATARNVRVELLGASWVGVPVADATFAAQDDEGDGVFGATLEPPDPRYQLPGQTKPVEFRIPAPLLPEGQEARYQLKIRVKYDYETSAVAQVSGYSRERYLSLKSLGRLTQPSTTSIPVQVSSNVPISIGVVGPDKIVVGPAYDEYTYQFTFRNIGTNLPITRNPATGAETDGLVLGTVWVQGPGIFFRRCLGVAPERLFSNMPSGLDSFFTSMQVQYKDKFSAWYQSTPWGDAWGIAGKIFGDVFISVEKTPQAPAVRWPSYVLFPNALSWEVMGFLMDPILLRNRGESITKSCTLGILNDPTNIMTWADRDEEIMTINAHLKYRYFVDQSLELKVTAPIVRLPFTG